MEILVYGNLADKLNEIANKEGTTVDSLLSDMIENYLESKEL